MKLLSLGWLPGLMLASASAFPVLPNTTTIDTPPAAVQPYLGQVTYVDFWASRCGPCAASFPWLNSLKARYGERLQVVGVGVDAQADAAAVFLQKHPAEFPILPDPKGELAGLYAIQGMPSAVILNARGEVVHQHSGFKAGKVLDYEAAIESALAAHDTAEKQP